MAQDDGSGSGSGDDSGMFWFLDWFYSIALNLFQFTFQNSAEKEELRRNPTDVGVTSGQKPCAKIIYIVLQTSVALF